MRGTGAATDAVQGDCRNREGGRRHKIGRPTPPPPSHHGCRFDLCMWYPFRHAVYRAISSVFPLPNRSVKRSSSLRVLPRFRKVSHPFVPMMGRKVSAAGKRMPEEIRPARLPLMKQGASHADSFSTEVGGVGLMRPPLGGRKLQNAACHLAILPS